MIFAGVFAGIIILLLLILLARIPAFIALLVASISAGLISGLSGAEVMQTVQNGMGSTLGFVATVIGLGAMFGAILESSGAAKAVSEKMLSWLGIKNAPLAMVITGFVVAIPVFFDVAFIILVPVIYSIQKSTGKSLLLFAIPLLSGLAITHAFIPPTPGPIAVADILGADLGWVILTGFLAGIPCAIFSGWFFGKYIGNRIMISAPDTGETLKYSADDLPSFGLIFSIILFPIVLILANTFVSSGIIPVSNPGIQNVLSLVGHPITALLLANLLVWVILGLRRGFTSRQLLAITTKSLAPAGTIILLTGAGGVFKQVLVDTGAGEILATSLTDAGLPLIVFAFIGAALIRVLQGSATVAMITAAGLVAPLILSANLSPGELAAMVISIASGASILSHVNDSGFWLVNQYLGMTEKQTFQSWTMMTLILAVTGFLSSLILFTIF